MDSPENQEQHSVITRYAKYFAIGLGLLLLVIFMDMHYTAKVHRSPDLRGKETWLKGLDKEKRRAARKKLNELAKRFVDTDSSNTESRKSTSTIPLALLKNFKKCKKTVQGCEADPWGGRYYVYKSNRVIGSAGPDGRFDDLPNSNTDDLYINY